MLAVISYEIANFVLNQKDILNKDLVIFSAAGLTLFDQFETIPKRKIPDSQLAA